MAMKMKRVVVFGGVLLGSLSSALPIDLAEDVPAADPINKDQQVDEAFVLSQRSAQSRDWATKMLQKAAKVQRQHALNLRKRANANNNKNMGLVGTQTSLKLTNLSDIKRAPSVVEEESSEETTSKTLRAKPASHIIEEYDEVLSAATDQNQVSISAHDRKLERKTREDRMLHPEPIQLPTFVNKQNEEKNNNSHHFVLTKKSLAALKQEKNNDMKQVPNANEHGRMHGQCMSFAQWALGENVKGVALVRLMKSTCEPAVSAGSASPEYTSMCNNMAGAIEPFVKAGSWDPQKLCDAYVKVVANSLAG